MNDAQLHPNKRSRALVTGHARSIGWMRVRNHRAGEPYVVQIASEVEEGPKATLGRRVEMTMTLAAAEDLHRSLGGTIARLKEQLEGTA